MGGGGEARDMDGSGADNGGTVVSGDPGAYAPTLEVLPLQQQFVAPKQNPSSQQIILQRV